MYVCRSIHESSRLGEIVEAVKKLETALIEDTGIASMKIDEVILIYHSIVFLSSY